MRTNRTDPTDPMPNHTPGEPLDVTTTGIQASEARQGGTGRPVLAVLIGGLALAALVWAGVEFYGNQLPGNTPGTEATIGQPSTESGDGLENDVPTIENPNGEATRQAVPSVDGSPAAKGQGEGPPISTNDGSTQGTGSTTNDPGSATTGGTAPNSPTP